MVVAVVLAALAFSGGAAAQTAGPMAPSDMEIAAGDSALALPAYEMPGPNGCQPACPPCGFRCTPCPNPWWVQAEYLLWWTKGMWVPPLLTTSPNNTPAYQAGVLDQPGTQIVIGDQELLTGSHSGGRIRFGTWADPCRTWAVQGEYFWLGTVAQHVARQSNGNPILARPFTNALTGQEDSELVAYPGIIFGGLQVDASGQLQSAGGALRVNYCTGPRFSPLLARSPCDPPGSIRWDCLLGYRFVRLDERLSVHEMVTSLDQESPGDFDIQDVFATRNQFHGADLGLVCNLEQSCWSLELLLRTALGNMHQTASIDGRTTTTVNGVPTNQLGGILAQRTNIGTFTQDRFAMVPEVGVTLGRWLTPRLRLTVGYTLLYVSSVLRPGEQIDTTLNPNLFPPEEVPFTGPARPAPTLHATSLWAQGLNVGLNYRW